MKKLKAGDFVECPKCGARLLTVFAYELTDTNKARQTVEIVYHVCIQEETKPCN